MESNELIVIVEQSGLEKTKGQVLLDKFSGYFKDAGEYEQKLNAIALKETPEKADIQAASVFRKAMKAKRVEVENTRKALKEESLREGQTIDSIAKILKNLIEPLEEKAESIEKYYERKAAAEKELRRQARMEALLPYNVAVQAGLIADMDEAMWENYFRGIVVDHEAKLEAERKAEAERIEAARIATLNNQRKQELHSVWQFVSDPLANFGAMPQSEFDGIFAEALASKDEWEKDQARIRIENERLQKEKEEADRILAEQQAKAKAEREAAEAEAAKKLAAERAERERIEAELKAKQQAEAAEKARIEAERIAKEKAEAKLKRAGDKARIIAWVESMTISGIGSEGFSDESVAVCNEIMAKFSAFKTWAKKQTDLIP